MANLLLINADGPGKRVALMQDGALVEFAFEPPGDKGLVGNIYRGRVVRVLPGMQAAFVDIGLDKAAFLYAGDVMGEIRGENEDDAVRPVPPIDSLLRDNQSIVVQVSREPIGAKGSRVSGHVSIAGRLLVLMPTVDHIGVSRRISCEQERERLRGLLQKMQSPGVGLIARTVADGERESALHSDLQFLTRLWQSIEEQAATAAVPSLIYSDLDLSLRMIRDLLSDDIDEVLIDDAAEHERVREFVTRFAPHLEPALKHYDKVEPMFDALSLEIEIDRALQPKVWLKSGGYLVIDETEALTSIDVNTGRFVGHRNVHDTILRTNLEAVREIVSQLRLRNIGGQIVIDFIDMQRPADRETVTRTLLDGLKTDRARSNVLAISEIGLVEMTRKRVRESLLRQSTEPCQHCEGRGYLKSAAVVCCEVLREIQRRIASGHGQALTVRVHADVAQQLADLGGDRLAHLERRLGERIAVIPQPHFHIEQFEVTVRA